MAAWPPVELLVSHIQALGAAGLFLLMLWSLIDCFFGYVIFRLVLAVSGLLAGAFIGSALVSWRIPSPSGLDYFLGCLVASGLLGLGGWCLYRLAFATAVSAAAAVLVVAAAAAPGSLGWWIFGGIVGLPIGVAAYVYLRTIFILLSGLGGGFAAVFCAGAGICGGADRLVAATPGPAAPTWLTVLLVAVALAVSATGIYAQTRLIRIVSTALTPHPKPRPRRPARSGRGPELLDRTGRLPQTKSRR